MTTGDIFMQREPTKDIAVLGGGSWGTAIALLLARKGYRVRLWVYEPELVDIINKTRENTIFLPGCKLPDNILPDNNMKHILKGVHLIVLVTPSQAARNILQLALPYIEPESIIVGASKGIENGTLLRISQIVEQVVTPNIPVDYIVLSGPTFASGVANELPTTAVVAGKDPVKTRLAQTVFNDCSFRVYVNADVTGVELGGALKNVIAIAAGIVAGLGMGSNTRAALITRGLWEITRLGTALGAKQITFQGLSGMGDLVLTCDGTDSRNFKVGYRIGRGETLNDIQSSMRMIAEGVKTTKSARELSHRHNVEMPITEQVYQTLYHEKPPRQAVMDLMTRRLKSEHHIDI
jgi:glycerol-3-phosphate dehydrogenase (NAD(P)+)